MSGWWRTWTPWTTTWPPSCTSPQTNLWLSFGRMVRELWAQIVGDFTLLDDLFGFFFFYACSFLTLHFSIVNIYSIFSLFSAQSTPKKLSCTSGPLHMFHSWVAASHVHYWNWYSLIICFSVSNFMWNLVQNFCLGLAAVESWVWTAVVVLAVCKFINIVSCEHQHSYFLCCGGWYSGNPHLLKWTALTAIAVLRYCTLKSNLVLTVHCCSARLPAHHLKVFISTLSVLISAYQYQMTPKAETAA